MIRLAPHIESLIYCKKCPHHVKQDSKSIVICRRHDLEVAVICQPSHDNKGFKNGTMIVRCGLKEEHI